MKNYILRLNARARSVALIVLTALFAVCLSLSATFLFNTRRAGALTSGIEAAVEYGDEVVVQLKADTTYASAVTVGSAKTVRVTGAHTLTFTGKLTVESEAVLTLDVETVFKGGVDIYGTLILNGRTYNGSAVNVLNKVDENAEIVSRGLVIGGSLNNDAANGGTINIEANATAETVASTSSSYSGGSFSNNDGGTLMLKANGSSLGFTNAGTFTNGGSVIYDNSGSLTLEGAVGANFVAAGSLFDNAVSGTTVVYGADETAVSVTVNEGKTLANAASLLSFGNVTYKFTDGYVTVNGAVSLGGGVSGDRTFTQGANELIFDGNAVYTRGAQYNYDRSNMTLGDLLVLYDTDGVTPYQYTVSGGRTNSYAFFTIGKGELSELSMYGGTKITNYSLTFKDKERGGGVYVPADKTFTMYGGEISRCTATGLGNDPAGAGVYTAGGTVNMYGGKVTLNGVSSMYSYESNGKTYYSYGSADGSGVACVAYSSGTTASMKNATMNMYGGEISYNHAALGFLDLNADGGGLMLHDSTVYNENSIALATANIYGGQIRGNFAGGSGGGVCAWNSTLNMSGGSITANRAAFGGGIGATANHTTVVNVSGGTISGNEAFVNYYNAGTDYNKAYGGYGGGICVGSSLHAKCSSLRLSGNVVIRDNRAYFGGGVSVYTQNTGTTASTTPSNYISMTGGLITGNAAYEGGNVKKYNATYETPSSANGGAVYVACTLAKDSNGNTPGYNPMLQLSGGASVDSSNSVSFAITNSENLTFSTAPIQVTADLSGSGLGALVCLDLGNDLSKSQWNEKDIISFNGSLTASTYINKFVLDSAKYAFAPKSDDKAIIIAEATDNKVAQIGSNQYATLREAVKAASDGDTIEILKSTTISAALTVEGQNTDGRIYVDKNLTIMPAEGKDVTLVVASDAYFGTNNALFHVVSGKTLTLSNNGTGSRLTVDGNGNGRKLKNNNVPNAVSLVYIDGGTFVMGEGVYLRNNVTTTAGSAVTVSEQGGTFTMNGGVIEGNYSTHATGSAVLLSGGGTFNWNGGKIADNVSENADANYGIYLSSNTSELHLNNTVTLTNNVIYVGRAKIIAERTLSADSSDFPLVMPSVGELTAGVAVVKIAAGADAEALSAKFTISNVQTGLSLGLIENNTETAYSHDIIIYKYGLFLFNANPDNIEGVKFGNETYKDSAALIAYLEVKGAESVKTRNGGYTLAVRIKFNTPLKGEGTTAISDYFTRTGYTVMGWGNISYNTSVEYNNVDYVTYNAVWQENTYSVTFDKNAPVGSISSATVNGDVTNYTDKKYSELESGLSIASTIYAKGFAFVGWSKTAVNAADENGTANLFANNTIDSEDITEFTIGERGKYSLTAYAVWRNIFGGGIGTPGTPFQISEKAHLENLKNAVVGSAVTVGEINYYNTYSGGSYAITPDAFSGYSFQLTANIDNFAGGIGDSSNPFGGTFSGGISGEDNYCSITLVDAGGGLFGNLSGATVTNLILQGSVSSTGNAGALADTATNTAVEKVASIASVTATEYAGGIVGVGTSLNIKGAFCATGGGSSTAVTSSGSAAGGIVGKLLGGTVEQSFNSAAVTGATYAGGIVGEGGQSGVTTKFENAYNTGKITATGVAGGIAGTLQNTSLMYIFNGGKVEGATKGAILGGDNCTSVTFTNVYFNTDQNKDVPATPSSITGATALTSSKMYTKDGGSQEMSLVGDWVYTDYSGEYHYPQLSVCAGKNTVIGDTTVGDLSRLSTMLTVPDEPDKPVTPEMKFTVTFYLVGGEYTPVSPFVAGDGQGMFKTEITFGDADADKVNVPQPADPTRTGYVFGGWYTDEACNNAYNFESGVSATNFNLYAKWTAFEYSLNYEILGGQLTGDYAKTITVETEGKVSLATGEPENVEEGVTYNLTRPGYYFVRWNYSYNTGENSIRTLENVTGLEIISDGGVFKVKIYHGTEETVINLSVIASHNGNEFRFTAEWQPRVYTITYRFSKLVEGVKSDLSEAMVQKIANTNAGTYTIDTGITFVNPSLEGYTFAGWENESGNSVLNIEKGTYGNIEVRGIFTPITYKIYFNERDGGKLVENGVTTKVDAVSRVHYVEVYYGEYLPDWLVGAGDSKKIIIEASRDGYEFKGWFRTTAGENEFAPNEVYLYGDITLYASYTIKSYTVTVKIDEADKAYGYFEKSAVNAANAAAVILDASSEKVYSYTVKVEHGKSAYGYLVSPSVGSGDHHFKGWNNLDGAITVTDDVEVSVIFGTSGFTAVVTNTYLTGTYSVVTLNIETAGGTVAYPNGIDVADMKAAYARVPGYDFQGWYLLDGTLPVGLSYGGVTDIDGYFERLNAFNFTQSYVLFAKYTAKKVTLDFQVNDPLASDGDKQPVLSNPPHEISYGTAFGTIPVPVYDGYKFNGWKDKNGNFISAETAIVSDMLETDADGNYKLSLTADWTVIEYKLEYNLTGGSIVSGASLRESYTIADTYGAGITIPTDGVAEREGYTLKSWQSPALSGNKINEGTFGDLTITASWEIKEYTLIFYPDVEGGTDGYFVVPQTVTEGTYKKDDGSTAAAGERAASFEVKVKHGYNALLPAEPVKEGYSFVKWAGGTYAVTSGGTVRPEFTERLYDLYFSANGGLIDGSGMTPAKATAFGSAIVAPASTPTREGYNFEGWFTAAEGGDELDADMKMPARMYTLYAHWTVKEYTVTITFTDAIDAVKEKLTDLGITATDTANGISFKAAHGTDLSALNGIKSGDKTLVFKDGENVHVFSVVKKDLDITAELSTYTDSVTVTFDYNDGNRVVEYPYPTGATIVFPEPTREGYTFAGWFTAAEGGDRVDAEGSSVTASATTYYAHWTAIEYKITYVLDGGTNSTENPSKYTVENMVNFEKPTKKGYTFVGWFDSSDTDVMTTENKKGDITLFAKWAVKTYKVTVTGYATNDNTAARNKEITLTYGSNNFSEFSSLWSRDYHEVKVYATNDAAKTSILRPNWTQVIELDETDGFKEFVENGALALSIEYTAREYKIGYYRSGSSGPEAVAGGTDDDRTFSFGTPKTGFGAEIKVVETGKTQTGWGVLVNGLVNKIDEIYFHYSAEAIIDFKLGGNLVTTSQPVEEIMLFPVFESTKYTVTFDKGEGTVEGSMTEQQFTYDEYQVLSENKYTRKGYLFTGWKYGELTYRDKEAVKFTGNETSVTFVAQWTAISYTITYVLGGGTNDAANPNTYTVENAVTFADPTKTGYTFGGWYYGGNRVESTADLTENITLTAEWTANKYTVTFDANGGTFADGVNNVITVTYGANYTLPADPTRLGYTFGGWYYGGKQITAASTVSTDYYHTVTAGWTAKTYTVTLKKDAETTHQTFSGLTVEAAPIILGSLTKNGYNFLGWKLDDEHIYTSRVTLAELLAVEDSDITLTAEFVFIEYTITYILDGGTNDAANRSTYNAENTVTFAAPEKTGYNFVGWFTAAEGGTKVETTASKYENLILFARWTKKQFTLTVSAGEGKFSDDTTERSITIDYGNEFYSSLYPLQALLTPDNSEQHFLQWKVKVGNDYVDINSYIITDNIEVKAVYSATHVSITLIDTNGTVKLEIVPANTSYTLPEPTEAAGYSNPQWYLSGSETPVGGTSVTPTQSQIYVAKAAPKSITVTFDANGGTFADGVVTEFTVDYDANYKLPASNPTRIGYTFLGWYYEKDGKKVSVTADLINKNVGNLEVKADWAVITYQITLDYNDGTNKTSTFMFNVEGGNVILPAPTRSGYTFGGWKLNDSKTFPAVATTPADLIAVSNGGKLTLVAVWTEIKYTLDLVNVTTTTISDITVNSGNISLDAPTKAHYTFNGWQYGTTLYSGSISAEDVIKLADSNNKLTLTASWTAISYTITYTLGGGTNSTENPNTYTVEDTFTLKDPARLGYTFTGWTGSNGETAQKNVTVSQGTHGELNYTANWQAISYTLNFTYADGTMWDNITATGSTAITNGISLTVNMDNNSTVTLPTVTRTGYTFAGWGLEGAEGVRYMATVSLSSLITPNGGSTLEYTFSVNWSQAVYRIDYVTNGGTLADNTPRSYRQGDAMAIPEPSRDNYEFVAWLKDNAVFGGITADTTGDITLTASWRRVTVVAEKEEAQVSFSIKESEVATFALGGWTYGQTPAEPAITGNLGYRFGAKVSAARAGEYGEWTVTPPEHAGEYYVLVYYLFDGANTAVPDLSNNNGWFITTVTVAKANNTIVLSESDIVYGSDYGFDVTRGQDATLTFEYGDADKTQFTSVKPVNAGDYTVRITAGETEDYLSAQADFGFTIKKARLTVRADGSGVYGDEFGAANCNFTFSGFAEGDKADMLKASYAAKTGGALVIGDNATSVEITGEEDNYEVVSVNGTYTVTKRAIRVIISDVTSVYSAPVDLSGVKVTVDGQLVGDDTLENSVTINGFETTATDTSDAEVYRITCKSYSSDKYSIEFISGNYRIAQADVRLTISAQSKVYDGQAAAVAVTDIQCADSRVNSEAILSLLKAEGAFTFIYSGSTADGNTYTDPSKSPVNAGNYYVTAINANKNLNLTNASVAFNIQRRTLDAITIASQKYTGENLVPAFTQTEYFTCTLENYVDVGRYPIQFTVKDEYRNNYAWADGTAITVTFEIVKAENAFTDGEFTVTGWAYGRYDASVNAPKGAKATFGNVIYTYSTSKDGEFTENVPTAASAGTYWVRAEVPATVNYDAIYTQPKQFAISKVVLDVPSIGIITDGNGKNDVYTGKTMQAVISGYDSALMSVTFENLVADGNKITMIATNAGSYTVKFALIDTVNYSWNNAEFDENGNAVRVWTVQKIKVAVPKPSEEVYKVSGSMLYYTPVGFDESVMNIEGNEEAFGGSYTVIVTLKDYDNYEWADANAPLTLEFNWEIDGINKIFVIILSIVGGLIVIAGMTAGAQCIVHAVKKKRAQKSREALSAEAEKNGGETPEQNTEGEAPDEIKNAQENAKEGK